MVDLSLPTDKMELISTDNISVPRDDKISESTKFFQLSTMSFVNDLEVNFE